jgi:hypothetical protein
LANDSKKSESAISKLRSKPFTTFTILIPPHSPVLLDTRGALPKVRLVDEDGQDHTPKSLITIGREMLVAVVHVIHSVPRRT